MATFHQSDLSSWARCAAQYGFRMRGLPSKTNSAAAYGSVMHHAILQVLERELVLGTPFNQALQMTLDTFAHFWNPANIHEICDPVPADGWLPQQGYSQLRAKGLDAIRKYADLIRYQDQELLATEFEFMVPIDGTWDAELGEPHVLAGAVDRLAIRHYLRKPVVAVDDLKCCAYGTPVLMADGSHRPVEQVRVGEMVVSWRDGKATVAEVLASADNGIQPCVRVESTYTDQVVTRDHPFLVDDTWVKADDLQTTDHLTVALDTSDGYMRMTNLDEAYALGVLVGDGYLGDHVKITQSETSVIDKLRASLPHVISNPTGEKGRNYSISNTVKPWLASHGLLGKRSADKFIPQAVREGGLDAQVMFLAGWFDTDGTVRLNPRPNVSWTTTSRVLADQGQRILLNLGVLATVVQVNSVYDGKPYIAYQLKVANAYGCAVIAEHMPSWNASKKVQLGRLRAVCGPDNGPPGPRNRWPAYGQDRVRSITSVPDQPTWALSVDGGVHITGNVVTHNTGKPYVGLRHNVQFTAYCYATTKREFWTGWRGADGFGVDRGTELFERLDGAGRRGTWISLRTFKFEDAGWRAQLDYDRFALAVEQMHASIVADIFPLSITGEVCRYCDYRSICGGTGLPDDEYGKPGRKAVAV